MAVMHNGFRFSGEKGEEIHRVTLGYICPLFSGAACPFVAACTSELMRSTKRNTERDRVAPVAIVKRRANARTQRERERETESIVP